MKEQFTHLVRLCCVLFFTCLMWFGAEAGVASNSYRFAEKTPLLNSDTTLVACDEAASDYSSWINTLRLQVQIPAENMGDSVAIVPEPPQFYSFTGPCGDTISLQFEIYDSTGTLKSNDRYVFIAVDNEPPAFSTPFGDTLRLTCADAIPPIDNVTVTDCRLDEVSTSETTESIGNCPLEVKITRSWVASDDCGQVSEFMQVIFVEDNEAPAFVDFPADTTIDCTSLTDTTTLGAPATDDLCDDRPFLSFFDQVTNNGGPGCTGTYTILRNWQVSDECGNTRTKVQRIVVQDMLPPTFDLPADTTLSCRFGDSPFFAGRPANVQDNCALLTEDNVTYEDLIVTDSCENIYTVNRTWSVTDSCGNTAVGVQIIEVVDEGGLVFTQPARDLILDCTADLDVAANYAAWIDTLAGAQAEDNCTPTEELTYQVLDSLTGQPATLPAPHCNPQLSSVYEQTILVVVTDACGQRDTSIAHFRVLDQDKPLITNCQSDTTLTTDPGQCSATYLLSAPTFIESCPGDLSYQYRLGNGPRVDADSLGPQELIVPQGVHLLTYYLTDCVGNADSCSFYLTVEDREPPQATCPSDTVVVLGANTCVAPVALQRPTQATDNCAVMMADSVPLVEYFVTGATQISDNTFNPGSTPTVVDFNLGQSTVYLIIRDLSGNADTCSYRVTVRDEVAPTVLCQPTALFINPSGLVDEEVGVQEVDAGSFDNCTLDTLYLEPFTFSCDLAGTVQDVVLTGIDQSGNLSQCSTIVRIENVRPQPEANSGLCGSDTLYLLANPPPATGGIVFQYQWSGPNGFTSNLENPFIPNISPENAGSYTVEITGITGCTATGTIEVAIEDLPLTPNVLVEQNYCVDEDITLESSVQPDGSQVVYRWYTGEAPDGTLFAETQTPTLTLPAPHAAGQRTFYVEVEADGCASPPSASRTFTINTIPTAIPEQQTISVCAGEAIMLGTPVSGPGITYEWTGPNGFQSASPFPAAIDPATTLNDGVYVLTVLRNGCASDPAFVNVDVLPRPARPELSNNGPVCVGEDVVLSTNADAEVYHWIAPDLREFSTTTDTFLLDQVTAEQSGNWRLYVTDFGCDSETSAASVVGVTPPPQPAAAAVQDVICEGSTMTLTASPDIANATYRWSGPNGYQAVGQTVHVENMRPSREGTYTLQITTQEGCSNTDAINIAVEESVRIIAATNDGPQCLTGPTDIRLTATTFPEDDGGFTYRWTGPNGFVATTADAVIPNATEADNGNYQLQVTTGEGCRSNVLGTLVDVNDPPAMPAVPAVSAGTPEPICEDSEFTLVTTAYEGTEVRYSWQTPDDGIIITDDPSLTIAQAGMTDNGNYSVFVTVDGCSSRESGRRRLLVREKPTATASSNTPVCAGQPLELRAVAPADARYLWSGPDFSSSLANPVIAVADSSAHAGTYNLVIEVDGCRSDAVSTTIDILPSPQTPALEQPADLCIDDPGAQLRLQLTDSAQTSGATYRWFGPNGLLGQSRQPVFDLADFSNLGSGLNSFYATAVLDACVSETSNLVDVDLNRIPDVQAFAGQDFSACETDNILLRGESPDMGEGRWTLIAPDTAQSVVITNPTRANSALNGITGGTAYTFRWTLSNGACKNYSFDDVTIDVNVSETADAGEDIIACSSREIMLDATPSISQDAFWSQTNVQELLGVNIVDATSPTPTITGMQPGNLYSFTWTVRSGCGDATDEVFVLISDPNPFAGADQVVCNEDNFAQLSANPPTEGSRGQWSSTDPDIRFSDGDNPNTTATRLKPGENIFIWEMDGGICGADSRDTVRIQYKRNPIAIDDMAATGFGQDIVIDVVANDSLVQDPFIQLVSQPDHGTVEVLGPRTLRYVPEVNFVGEDRFLYELCSEACACSLAEVALEVGNDARCDVPSIITPNNDGINDVFAIPCLLDESSYPNSQLIIFNQWGDEVYRSPRPYPNNWNGQFNGEDLAPGTYFYLLDFGDGSRAQNGFFMIQR